jgi:transposase
MAKTRRIYSPEFKAEAVKLVTEQGYAIAEAARSLGINDNLIRNWKHALQDNGEHAFPGRGKLSPFEEENRRLRAENKRLLAEPDILTKAAAFFAREATEPTASSTNTRISGPCAGSAKRWESPPPATTLGGNAHAALCSNDTTPSWWRSGLSTPSSRHATAARVSMPSWRPAATTAASTRSPS